MKVHLGLDSQPRTHGKAPLRLDSTHTVQCRKRNSQYPNWFAESHRGVRSARARADARPMEHRAGEQCFNRSASPAVVVVTQVPGGPRPRLHPVLYEPKPRDIAAGGCWRWVITHDRGMDPDDMPVRRGHGADPQHRNVDRCAFNAGHLRQNGVHGTGE
jgi:hypothetical protein